MTREIKFRGWDGAEKRMWSWHELQHTHFMASLYSHGDGSWEVMQYTGLRDKNGMEIYEGDILELCGEFDEGFHPYHRSQVEFLDGAFCIEDHFEYVNPIPLSAWIEDSAGEHNIKVIGNIYENADLLSNTVSE